jgi:hypothetical protein
MISLVSSEACVKGLHPFKQPSQLQSSRPMRSVHVVVYFLKIKKMVQLTKPSIPQRGVKKETD